MATVATNHVARLLDIMGLVGQPLLNWAEELGNRKAEVSEAEPANGETHSWHGSQFCPKGDRAIETYLPKGETTRSKNETPTDTKDERRPNRRRSCFVVTQARRLVTNHDQDVNTNTRIPFGGN